MFSRGFARSIFVRGDRGDVRIEHAAEIFLVVSARFRIAFEVVEEQGQFIGRFRKIFFDRFDFESTNSIFAVTEKIAFQFKTKIAVKSVE